MGAATLGALVPMLAVPAAVAADAPGAALISLDGTSFERSLQGGIFPSGTVLVPGGTVTGTFYVKNDSDRAADLRISVAGASSASATFIDALTLQAATPASPDAAPVPLSSDTDCISLFSGELLRSNQVTAVQITLAMDADADNNDQGADAAAALVVALTDPTAPDSAEYGCTDGGGIPLLPGPDAEPLPERPMSETTDPIPAVNAPQPTVPADRGETEPEKTGVATPAVDAPPTAGALPLPTESPLPLTWLGTAGLALGMAGYLVLRLRKRYSG
jgi:hypothetical protein